MPNLGMEGAFNLDTKTIENKIEKTSAGNYALGRKNDEGIFLISYIGRSDSDIKKKLHKWVGRSKSDLFKFKYASSVREAFVMECDNFHDFVHNDKIKHPERPKNTDWKCPRCKKYQ